ncbi:MAG: helix-hairpin-helix domain-containing protein [Cyanobacteria bacterium SBLK]|nr:helix-hairpin-helix domain-containing protein [Cyanobacteria bacterium SBLK]
MGIYRVNRPLSSGHRPGDIIDSDRPEFKPWDIPAMVARGHIELAPKGATPTDAPVQLPVPDTPDITASVATTTPEEQENPSTEAKPTKTNLNTASKTALKELPGIGDSSADALIAARPLQALDRVWETLPHIKGEKRAELEPLIEL